MEDGAEEELAAKEEDEGGAGMARRRMKGFWGAAPTMSST